MTVLPPEARHETRGGPGASGSPGGPRGSETGFALPKWGKVIRMAFLLWLLAVVLVIAGVVSLFRKDVLDGVLLIVVGLLVGPGGVSVFT